MKHITKLLSLLLVLGLVFGLFACVEREPDDDEPTTVNMLGDWMDGGDEVYTLDINSENALSFTFDKQTYAWAAVVKDFSDSLASMKTLIITLQGSGVPVLFKLESEDGTLAREVQLNANPTLATYQWDFTGDEDFLALAGKMLLFAAPNQTGVSGNVLISKLEFTMADATGNVITSGHSDFVAPDPNIYDGVADSFGVINWYDGGDSVYDVTEDNGVYVVAYDKTLETHHWSFIRADLQGPFSNFAKLEFVITGELGQTALLKIEGPAGFKELPVTFDGTEQTFVMDLMTLLPASLDALDKIVIFGSQGTTGTGSFTLHSVTFLPALTDINSGWYSLDEGVYVPTENLDGSVDVVYDKASGNEWSVLKLDIDAAWSSLNTLTLVIQGEAGQNFIIKPNDDGLLEKNITLTDDQPLTLTFEGTFTSIILFAMPNVAPATGTFTIVSATLDYVPAVFDPTLVYDFNNEWFENDPGTYEFEVQPDGSVKVFYAQSGWNYMRRNFDISEVAGLNTMTITLSGTVGKQVLLKPNDSGAMETWVTFEDAEPLTFVFRADTFANLLIFAEGGTAAIGDFTIHEAYLSYTYDITAWQETDVYDITENVDGSLTVDYDKVDNSWAFFRVDFPPMVDGLNTLTMVLSGSIGQTILIKPNDQGALEEWVTFDSTDPLTLVFKADAFTTIIMFAEAGTDTASGTFTIHEATLTYVPIVFDPDKVLDINTGHISGDAGVYTFTVDVDGVLVEYDKIAGQEWSFMRINIDQEEAAGLNTLTIVLKGTPGEQVLIKPNDMGALEQWVTFVDETEITIVIEYHTFLSVLLFAEGGTAPADGEFTIVSAELSYTEPDE